MIDTLNAGQTCRRCRHYQDVHMVQDPFFGEHPVKDWCSKRKRHIEIADGADCRLFLRSMFRGGSRYDDGNAPRSEEAS